ncbi:hypothetical protein GQ54DRAFT_296534 [Martensiomyces pterosporus]|nr:hypothetical protein GQ54DRAFT_296534 [Martensiomyces pterosporus]
MGLSDTEESNRPEFYHEDDEMEDAKPAVNPASDVYDDDMDDLDLSEVGNKVWLVKVPQFLAKKWGDSSGSGAEIGTVRIFDKPDKQGNNISLILPDTEGSGDIPKEYNLKVTNNNVQNMLVFSESRDPKQEIKPTSTLANKSVPTALTGRIIHECIVTPTFNERYQDIMRRRAVEAGKPVRTMRLLSEQHRNNSMFKPSESSSFVTTQKKSTADNRMARMDRKDLMDLLFSAFEKYPYWSFKGLVEHTRQPTAFLKEVLADVAVLNKRGPYAATYSIKSEFRNSTNTAPDLAAASAGASGSLVAAGGQPGGDRDDLAGNDDDMGFNDDEDEDFEDV